MWSFFFVISVFEELMTYAYKCKRVSVVKSIRNCFYCQRERDSVVVPLLFKSHCYNTAAKRLLNWTTDLKSLGVCSKRNIHRTCRAENNKILQLTRLVIMQDYYMLALRPDKMNQIARYDWLHEHAGKMERSCPLGTTRCIPQEKFPGKPYNKSFID